MYRADFALGTLMRFLPIITQIFLWTAIFEASGRSQLVGYTRDQFIAYYLLTMIARAFSSMPGLASGIARQIREGEIKKYLIQPVDMLGFLLLGRVAHKVAYYSVAFMPFAFVFFLCRSFFYDLPPEAATHSFGVFAAFLMSLLLSFLLGYFMEASLGLIGFWFLEVNSLLFVFMLFNFFLSGHMFPLDMLELPPESIEEPWRTLWVPFRTILIWSPLQYLAYTPAAIFLGKYSGAQLIRVLLLEVAWLAFFVVLARVLFSRGLKRYSGYGG